MDTKELGGIYAAAVTTLHQDGSIAIEGIQKLLSFLRFSGVHGALLFGTTGEGPSFSPEERETVWMEAAKYKAVNPDFRLIAGTGTPSLDESIQLNKMAFEMGFDAVLSLPPYYFRNASEEGLLDWFSYLIEDSVPENGNFMAYHFPQVSGVPLSLEMLIEIKSKYPKRFVGVKDSSGDFETAKNMVEELDDVQIFVGNDMLLSKNLELGGAGSITAATNLTAALMRRIYEDFKSEKDTSSDQNVVDQIREIVNGLMPFPASMKALLTEIYGLPSWSVKAPLRMLGDDLIKDTAVNLRKLLDI